MVFSMLAGVPDTHETAGLDANNPPPLLGLVFVFAAWMVWRLISEFFYGSMEKPAENPYEPEVFYPSHEKLPPFADTWYVAALSHEVPYGSILPSRLTGCDIILYREEKDSTTASLSKTQTVHCIDAVCPQLGADLRDSICTKVVGDSVHWTSRDGKEWKFQRNGKVTPVNHKLDSHADDCKSATPEVHCYPVCERNCMVYVFNPASKNVTPTWLPYVLPTDNNPDFTYVGCEVSHVYCHIQDIAENGADFAHFSAVHDKFMISGPVFNSITHEWTGTWQMGDKSKNEGHLAHMDVGMDLKFLGWKIPGTHVFTYVMQDGLGAAYLHINLPFASYVLVQSIKAVGLRHMECYHYMFGPRRLPKFVGQIALHAMTAQFKNDMPIWNNKKYAAKPMAVKGDGPLLQYRRYCNQFYLGDKPFAEDGTANSNTNTNTNTNTTEEVAN